MWIDLLMPGSADWNPEIEAKARACDIFVLLVSANSTGSDYIVDKEIPIVRERQRNSDGVWIYPLLLDWTPKAGLEQVNDKNLRPRDAKPFLSLPPSERSRAMAEAAHEIAEVAKAVEERKAKAAAMSEKTPKTGFMVGLIERIAPRKRRGRGRRQWSISAACRKPATSGWSGATQSLRASMKCGATTKPTFSRSSPRVGRASRPWSTSG